MSMEGRCELCDEDVKGIVHFLLHCGEFASDRGRLLDVIKGIG